MKHFLLPRFVLAIAILIGMTPACNDDKRPDLLIGTAYDAADFGLNTVNESSTLGLFDDLTVEMKKGRTAGVQVDLQSLQNLYNGGFVPGISAYTIPYYDAKIGGPGGWLEQLVLASGNTYQPGQTDGEGGVYGGYLFDENGVEYEQLVQKGLFGAALYNRAIVLMSDADFDAADADRLLKVFGAAPAFKNSDNATKHGADADKYLAAYAARRDKNDGKGLYTQLRAQFLKLQAATQAGDEYRKERDEALAEIRILWEKANAATVINYCHSSIAQLSATNPTDTAKAAALHSLSENVGFLHGWRTLSQPYRKITDTQIDQYLNLLNAPANGKPELYKFATEPALQLPKLLQLIEDLQTLYGFTEQEVEDFKKNWVSEQGR